MKKMLIQILIFFALDQDAIVIVNYLAYFNHLSLFILS